MNRTIDMTGQKIGRLVVLREAGILGRDKATAWLCRCDCGTEKVIRGTALRSQTPTLSCGCLNLEKARQAGKASTTHGMSRTPVYECWIAMRSRCLDPNNPNYHHYGGRGITICDRWRDDPKTFAADMGPRPRGHSIERVDNDGPYSPDNCIWLPRLKQARNKRTNLMITHDGKTMCLAAWAEYLDLSYGRLREPLRRGETFATAIEHAALLTKQAEARKNIARAA